MKFADEMGSFMKYAIEMGSFTMIYITNFIKIGSGIEMLIGGGGYSDTQAGWRSHKLTESRLKTKYLKDEMNVLQTSSKNIKITYFLWALMNLKNISNLELT
jgi:hypothetical protein